jgi:hypothetical protein
MFIYSNLLSLCCLLSAQIAFADTNVATAEVDLTNPRSIMGAVQDRAAGDKVMSQLEITIIDKDGRKRKRTVTSRALDFTDEKIKGTKQIMIFKDPSDIKGTGLLSIDYDDGAKEDDQWLYLPSLKKATRISSSDKSGSFMGTDLSYADMTQSDPDHYEYQMLKTSAKVKMGSNIEECWLIESRPKSKKAKKETGYVKSLVWVSKEKMMPIQVKAMIRKGKKTKYIQFREIKKVDGLWTAHAIIARTKRGKTTESTTTLVFQNMSYNNSKVVPSDFSLERLEQGFSE